MIKLSDEFCVAPYKAEDNVYGLYHTYCMDTKDPFKGVFIWSDMDQSGDHKDGLWCNTCSILAPSVIVNKFRFMFTCPS